MTFSLRTVGWARHLCARLAAAACMAAVAAAAPALPTAAGSTLSLGPRGVQSLVADQLFNRDGRWFLIDDAGVCYTYLEAPHVRLASDRLVQSRIAQPNGAPPLKVDWRVGKSAKGYKINDVVVEGVSMAVTQRQEFASVIQRNGGQIDALLKLLREKTGQSAEARG